MALPPAQLGPHVGVPLAQAGWEAALLLAGCSRREKSLWATLDNGLALLRDYGEITPACRVYDPET